MFRELAKEVRHDKQYGLGDKLGKSTTQVENMRIKYNNDIDHVTITLLVDWKNEHGDGPKQKEMLRSIFEGIKLGGLFNKVVGPKPAQQHSPQGSCLLSLAVHA